MKPRLRPLPHQWLQLVSLLALALIPVVMFGLTAWGHLGGLATSDAERETRKTLDAATAVLRQDEQDLSRSIGSYATWDQLVAKARSGDAAWVKSVVLDFVVEQDIADAAVVKLPGATAATGSDATVRAIADEISAAKPSKSATLLLGLPDGVYDLALWPIDAGEGSDGAVLAFARRLDERFVAEARAMTGWDVAVADVTGSVRVSTSGQRFVDLASSGGPPAASRQTSSLAGGARPLIDHEGRTIGWLLVATDRGALGSISDQMLALLAITLAPAVVGALLLSVGLSFQIRRRLRVVESGIAAVEAGDLSVRLPEGDRDEFERLASSHNRLARALDHEDVVLDRVLDATSALPPDAGVSGVAQLGVDAAVAIFGLEWCELRSADGAVAAAGGEQNPAGGELSGVPVAENTIDVAHGDRHWQIAYRGLPQTWARADQALLRVYAEQLGAALADAELYERAEDRADALDRLNRLQANFLRGVSHNLQSPLTSIVGLSDELRTREDVADDARRRAAVIHADAQRLRMLVRQLLTMSRLEAGTLRVEPDACAVEPILRRSWEALRSDRPFEIVRSGPAALAIADADALEQVFWILLDNAVRYAPRGPVRVEVSSAGAARLRVVVEDEGPGVPEAERSLVFERFARGSTSAGHDGTGLGLDVARGLLEAMGGSVRYEPVRVGAAFVVELPAGAGTPV